MATALPLPEGTVTFLFTDIEGSTKLLQQLGDRYPDVLAEHQRLLRAAFEAWGGREVDTQGDSFFVAFRRAADAVAAAVEAQRALIAHRWPEGTSLRVRMGLHTGEPTRTASGYVGLDVHRAARISAAGHGGQILLSQTTRDLVEHDSPAGVSLRNLGSYRLKDLQNPEPIFQVLHPDLPADCPPLNSLDTYSHNLPVQPTGLVGREQELAITQDLLRRAGVRLLTLTGPGGIGKTRLGLQLAADLLDDFPDGVFFVGLSSITDPALVPTLIVQSLGLQESTGRPLLERLKDHLRDKRILLLLDNFEHVLAAAPMVGELLAACPGLKLLVTSRTSLHLRGEKEFQVPPLALPQAKRLPSLETLSQYTAVALFIQRARDVQHDFALTDENAAAVAEICLRLDGLPLAIELAAARIRLLSPSAMLARLDSRLKLLTGGARDLPARQQTLRNAISWSYDLLDEAEKTLFRRLSVFVGGCTLEAAEAVCNAMGDLEVNFLDGLEALVGDSLLRLQEVSDGEPRFVMSETIREYGRECLEEKGEAGALRRQHAQFFLALAEAAEPKLSSMEQAEWLARLETEHDNLRAVLDWSLESGEVEVGLRLAGALCNFWMARGYWAEGQERLKALLALPGAGSRSRARAMALHTAARLAYCRGEIEIAHSQFEESLTISRELSDLLAIATSLVGLGDVARLQGDLETARACYEEAVAAYRELDHKWCITFPLSGLGDVARLQGDLETARARYAESLHIRRELGDQRAITISLNGLGHVARLQGQLETARALYAESLGINRELGEKRGVTFSLHGLGHVARLEGDLKTAYSLFQESLEINRELGDKRGTASSLSGLGDVARLQGDLETARRLYEESLALQQKLGDKSGIAYTLDGLGLVARAQGDDAAAISLREQSLAIQQELQSGKSIAHS